MGERDWMLVAERSDLFLLMKANEWFRSCFSLLLYGSFLVTVTWHFMGFFPFLVIVTWLFHMWNLFSFLVRLYRNLRNLVLSRSFYQFFFRSVQMAAIMSQTNASFYTKILEKSLFISAISYEKYIVCKDYCIAHHDEETCFLPACKYHIMLRGNVEELLKMLDTFCFTYQHVDCLYTLFKYRFSGKVIAKSGQVFDNVQPAVDFNHRNKGVDRMPSIAKKRLVRKKFKTIYSAPFKRETNADQWISIWRKSWTS